MKIDVHGHALSAKAIGKAGKWGPIRNAMQVADGSWWWGLMGLVRPVLDARITQSAAGEYEKIQSKNAAKLFHLDVSQDLCLPANCNHQLE